MGLLFIWSTLDSDSLGGEAPQNLSFHKLPYLSTFKSHLILPGLTHNLRRVIQHPRGTLGNKGHRFPVHQYPTVNWVAQFCIFHFTPWKLIIFSCYKLGWIFLGNTFLWISNITRFDKVEGKMWWKQDSAVQLVPTSQPKNKKKYFSCVRNHYSWPWINSLISYYITVQSSSSISSSLSSSFFNWQSQLKGPVPMIIMNDRTMYLQGLCQCGVALHMIHIWFRLTWRRDTSKPLISQTPLSFHFKSHSILWGLTHNLRTLIWHSRGTPGNKDYEFPLHQYPTLNGVAQFVFSTLLHEDLFSSSEINWVRFSSEIPFQWYQTRLTFVRWKTSYDANKIVAVELRPKVI